MTCLPNPKKMPKISAFLVLCLGLAFGAQAAPKAANEPTVNIDWSKFLSRSDLVWDSVPATWDEAALLGNGLMGALIYTNKANELRWDIARTDVTDHREGPNPMFRKPRLPIGRMVLIPAGKITGGSARLDLWNAEAHGVIQTDQGEIRWRSLIHSDDMVLAVELETTGGERKCRWQWRPAVAVNPRKLIRKFPLDNQDINPAPFVEERGDTRVSVQLLQAGGEYATAWTEQRISDDKRRLYLSVNNTFDKLGARDEAVKTVEAARTKGWDPLIASHRDWWHAYYPQSFLSIPDTQMESYYWIQIYKLGSATRADRPAIDCIGPWYGPSPWPGIWWDMNIQVVYSPVYTANRLELGESLTRMLDRNKENLVLNVPKEFRQDSSGIGTASSYDCLDDVDIGPTVGIVYGRADSHESMGNLVWICHNYWLQYRYSMDDAMLRDRLFPLLRRAVNYYFHVATRGADGKLHLPKAWSPEYPTRTEDTNFDLALFRWGCETLLAATERLKLNDPLIPQWKQALADLTPYPVDDTGLMIGRDVSMTKSHRHYSHMLGAYPLRIINSEQPGQRELIARSLDHWINVEGGKGFAGFSFVGASGIAASLGDGEKAVKYLHDLMGYAEPNTLARETGPVTETSIAGATVIQELLLQTWGGKIRVFPAVPKDWSDVSFHNLRAEGAFLVGAVRRGGQTQFVTVTSLAGEPCSLKTDMKGPLKVLAKRDISLRTLQDGVVELDLRKGETATLCPQTAPSNLVIGPVAPERNNLNFFGSAAVAKKALDQSRFSVQYELRDKPDNLNVPNGNEILPDEMPTQVPR